MAPAHKSLGSASVVLPASCQHATASIAVVRFLTILCISLRSFRWFCNFYAHSYFSNRNLGKQKSYKSHTVSAGVKSIVVFSLV